MAHSEGEIGFQRADSNNLPSVDSFMVLEFIKSNDDYSLSEIRGAKADKSMRSAYIEAAVGFVEVKREGDKCIIRGQVCPEHRISKKNYIVQCEIDEKNDIIESAKCFDCAASAGGCKHSLAFLVWVEKKSSEPSPTETVCYWKKPQLSNISQREDIKCSDFGTVSPPRNISTCNVAEEFVNQLPLTTDCILKNMKQTEPSPMDRLSLYKSFIIFKNEGGCSSEDFLKFISLKTTPALIQEALIKTIQQSDSPLWHELRFARVTASQFYNVSHCRTERGSLVKLMLGASLVPETKAIQRGKSLEKNVLKVFCNKKKVKCEVTGFKIYEEEPIFGASPDALGPNFIVEIKCPSKKTTIKNYIAESGVIAAKVKYQMQLQMLIFNKPKGYLVVADPEFETNSEIHVCIEHFDEQFVKGELIKAKCFWENNIFPCLK